MLSSLEATWALLNPVELGLAAVIIAFALASAHRIASIAFDRRLPPRFARAPYLLALVPRWDFVRRRRCVTDAVRAALGVGRALPILAWIAPSIGTIAACRSLIWSGHVDSAQNGSSRAEIIAARFGIAWGHVAAGLALALAAAAGSVFLVAAACRVTRVRVGPAYVFDAYRELSGPGHTASVLYWAALPVLAFASMPIAFLFLGASFSPHVARLSVNTGACGTDAPTIAIHADGGLSRVDARRATRSGPERVVERLMRPTDREIAIQVDDGVAYAAIVSVVDAILIEDTRTVCLPNAIPDTAP